MVFTRKCYIFDRTLKFYTLLSDFYLLVYGRSKSGNGKGLELIHFCGQTVTETLGESMNIPLPDASLFTKECARLPTCN